MGQPWQPLRRSPPASAATRGEAAEDCEEASPGAGGTASLVSAPGARRGAEPAAGEEQAAATLTFAPRNGLLRGTMCPNLPRGPSEQGYPLG